MSISAIGTRLGMPYWSDDILFRTGPLPPEEVSGLGDDAECKEPPPLRPLQPVQAPDPGINFAKVLPKRWLIDGIVCCRCTDFSPRNHPAAANPYSNLLYYGDMGIWVEKPPPEPACRCGHLREESQCSNCHLINYMRQRLCNRVGELYDRGPWAKAPAETAGSLECARDVLILGQDHVSDYVRLLPELWSNPIVDLGTWLSRGEIKAAVLQLRAMDVPTRKEDKAVAAFLYLHLYMRENGVKLDCDADDDPEDDESEKEAEGEKEEEDGSWGPTSPKEIEIYPPECQKRLGVHCVLPYCRCRYRNRGRGRARNRVRGYWEGLPGGVSQT